MHALAQSLVGNKDLVRFLNARMNGIGPALKQWGMGLRQGACKTQRSIKEELFIMAIVGLIKNTMAKK